jgi:hypothetical protein
VSAREMGFGLIVAFLAFLVLAAMVLILTLGDGSGIEIAGRHKAW